MKLLCNLHRETHHMTAGQVERLVYGLQAALADAEEEIGGSNLASGEPVEALYTVCPLHQLQAYDDVEMYAEHIEPMVEARRSAETQGGAR